MNKSLGRGRASGIEKGEQATAATKETIGTMSRVVLQPLTQSLPGVATDKAQQTANVAGQKANQV